jgi:type VI secretion system secreted protein Hcp
MLATARARSPKSRRLGVERLEARDVPAWAVSPLATFAGEVTTPHEPDWVQMQVQTSSPRVLLTFESTPTDGSDFEPGRLSVFAGDGAHAGPTRASGPGYALRGVSSGMFFARTAAADGTTGAFDLSVGLAGDVNGDHQVDTGDIDAIRGLRGTRAGDDGFVPAADVNHNGVIGRFDVRLARRNLGDSATVGPLTIDQFLFASSDALGLTRGGVPRAASIGPKIAMAIPGIQGAEQIEVHSFSWGVTLDVGTGGIGGGGAGKPVKQDFYFTKDTDVASPKLFLACASGQHFPSATLSVKRGGPRSDVYLTIKMNDVLVTSYQVGGTEGAGAVVPAEQLSLNFTRITMEFIPLQPDGKPGTPVKGGYDFLLNKAI